MCTNIDMLFSSIKFNENSLEFNFIEIVDEAINRKEYTLIFSKLENMDAYMSIKVDIFSKLIFSNNEKEKINSIKIYPFYICDVILPIEEFKISVDRYTNALINMININLYKYIAAYLNDIDRDYIKPTINSNIDDLFSKGITNAVEKYNIFAKSICNSQYEYLSKGE